MRANNRKIVIVSERADANRIIDYRGIKLF